MVTAATAALVLVLLQLHASDTLKEDSETLGPQPSPPSRPQPPQLPPPPGSPKTTRIHNIQRGITSQDEDLLDLMVRIAETPEEWERIHRVLSLLGREKDSYETPENNTKLVQMHSDENTTNFPESDLKLPYQDKFSYKVTSTDNIDTHVITPSTTMAPLTTTFNLNKEAGDQVSGPNKVEDTDTGWPDFEEAIVKKVKKSQIVDENDILESNWLEDDWLDPTWNNYLNDDKNKLPTSQLAKILSPVSFKSSSNEKTSFEESGEVPRSRLFRDPKILEFRLNNVTPLQNNTVEHNISEETNGSSSRGDRPVFVYHRVTTSPQERKGNSAFIAVSVVRQSPAETPPPTTLPPHHLWDQIHRIKTPVKDSTLPKNHKKHPHWRQEVHWHRNRGRRHHHTHTHSHTNTHH